MEALKNFGLSETHALVLSDPVYSLCSGVLRFARLRLSGGSGSATWLGVSV